VISHSYTLDSYVMDTLMRDLVGHDRRPSAYLVFLALYVAAIEGSVSISIAELAERTGLSKRSVQSSMQHLKERSLVETKRASATDVPRYHIIARWRQNSRK
jgi:transcription initiation factor IIE alpha subunit